MSTKQNAIDNYIKVRLANDGFDSKKDASNYKHMMTAGELRKALEGVADDTPVLIEIFEDAYTSCEIPLFFATDSTEQSDNGDEADHFILKGMDNSVYPEYKKAWKE